MITDGKKWHYLAVKSLSTLLRGITPNHNGDFYCLNCQKQPPRGVLKKRCSENLQENTHVKV